MTRTVRQKVQRLSELLKRNRNQVSKKKINEKHQQRRKESKAD